MNVKTKSKLNKIVNQIETQISTIIQQICPLHEHTGTPQMVMNYNSFLTCRRGQIFDMGRLTIPWGFGSDHSCCHLRLGGHPWWMLWSSGMEPSCPPSGSQDLQVGCCGMSDASVGDGAAHGDSQQTTLPVVLELLLLLTCHLDNLLIWMFD